ncbi:MAG: hypothetical protein HC876_14155 [Chloroflexaceae bacterium]|nr:hypothetical protein [Chloroflexaceae bacterium]NJO06566.1 hypothetical protein [Chloroflexaceae bacterium]
MATLDELTRPQRVVDAAMVEQMIWDAQAHTAAETGVTILHEINQINFMPPRSNPGQRHAYHIGG